MFWKVEGVIIQKQSHSGLVCIMLTLDLSSIETFVDCIVGEVITPGKVNILGPFDDGWTKIFVTMTD